MTAFANAPAVRGNLTPHPGAQLTGRFHNGQPVYRRALQVPRREPMRDADGNLLYHLNPDGTKRAPRWMNVFEEQVVEGIYVDHGNGVVTFETAAVPSVEEIEREAALDAARAQLTPEFLLDELRRLREDMETQREALEAVGLNEEDLRRFREQRKQRERTGRRER